MEPPNSLCGVLFGMPFTTHDAADSRPSRFCSYGNFCLDEATNSLLAFTVSAGSSATRRVRESS